MQDALKEETNKWLYRIKGVMHYVKSNKTEEAENILENINAYIKDSEYFLKKGQLIEAFEAVIWAWSWYTIGTKLGILVKKEEE